MQLIDKLIEATNPHREEPAALAFVENHGPNWQTVSDNKGNSISRRQEAITLLCDGTPISNERLNEAIKPGIPGFIDANKTHHQAFNGITSDAHQALTEQGIQLQAGEVRLNDEHVPFDALDNLCNTALLAKVESGRAR